MFRDVLIATDGSNLSLEVLKPVSRLLAPLKGGRLIVLHVLPRESETAYSTRERCLNTANAALEKAKLRLVDLRWSVETLVEEGDPAEQILQVAEREAVDLIALASWTAGYHLSASAGSVMVVGLELLLFATISVSLREGN